MTMRRELLICLAYTTIVAIMLTFLALSIEDAGAPVSIVHPVLWATCFMVGWTSRNVVRKFGRWKASRGKEK